MNDSDFQQMLASYTGRNLEQRKHWYFSAAEAYNQVSPDYPQDLIRRVTEIA